MITTSRKRRFIFTSLVAIIMLFVVWMVVTHHSTKSRATPINLPKSHLGAPVAKQRMTTHQVVVKSGDTLEAIFARLCIPSSDLWTLLKKHNTQLTQLRPDQELLFTVDKKHHLHALQIPISADKVMLFQRYHNQFNSKVIELKKVASVAYKDGVIQSSLAEASKDAGLTDRMYYQLVKIFQGQVNFAHDMHPGDRFAVLYKEYYINGHKFRPGNIIAAQLIMHDGTHRAFRFTYPKDHTAYYTPKGRGIQPRFLSYPLHFKRISSHFNRHRFDPVLHRIYPHLGVDFAAKRGTPIRSIGNGRIIFIGRDHGYGNAIKIRYDRHYTALYGHMKMFAKNLKRNQYIHKGEIIGYVGSTGWSTGPHLHFGIYVNGIAKNWLALKRPTTPPIPRRYHNKFNHTVQTLLATLALHEATELAANNTGIPGTR